MATIPVGHQPSAIVVDPSGRRVFVANWGDNTVSIIEARTDTVAATVEVDDRPCGMAEHPAGTKLYVTGLRNTLWVIDTAKNAIMATINLGSEQDGTR